jgi:glucose/arabinose dehydrogenase
MTLRTLATPALTAILLAPIAWLPPTAVHAQSATGQNSNALLFDTYVPGPCSPNGQSQGNCDPGDLLRVRLVPVAEGLNTPRHISFLPNGDLLITEPDRIRIVRDGELAGNPIAGFPAAEFEAGMLQAVVVHPDFAANQFVYIYYVKGSDSGMTTLALARGRLENSMLVAVREIFVVDGWINGGPIAGRAIFGPDGMLYLTLNDHDPSFSNNETSIRMLAQDLGSDVGKIMRIRDDGGIPDDNPFVGQPGAKPEIFSYGHRNATDIAWHPASGEPWSTEVGPMGGDELNVLRPGANYGWPVVSLGRIYNEAQVSEQSWWRPGMEMPVMHWTPSISPSTVTFYSGDRIPEWRGHLFIGALNGQMLQRIAFNQPAPQAERREALFMPLGRRFRHVVEGPDGYLYLATVVRILGAEAPSGPNTSGAIYRVEAVR